MSRITVAAEEGVCVPDNPIDPMLAEAKQAAILQWNADPCGPVTEAPVGSTDYWDQLVQGRNEYAPWMASALDYRGSRNLSVLDIGCGQGIDLVRYAAAGASVTGIDLTPRHVEIAREHLRARGIDADVVRGDAEALPFPDGSFDRVSSNGVLHHTPDIEAALLEARRVLRPGGLATLILYNKHSLHYWVHQVLGRGILCGGLLREHTMGRVLSKGVERTSIGARPLVRVYSPREASALLARAGFTNVTTDVCPAVPNDTFLTKRFTRWPRLLKPIATRTGWYVIAKGSS